MSGKKSRSNRRQADFMSFLTILFQPDFIVDSIQEVQDIVLNL
jgi:hypothetical protein